MKAYASGIINREISVAGNLLYPAWLVRGKKQNMMIDAGLNLLGPLYLHSLEKQLGSSQNLHYLLVTHSHYDHLGAMPYLKRKIPDLKLGGHPRIPELMKKSSVIKTMESFSERHRDMFNDTAGSEDVSLERVDFDLSLREGDTIDLGDLTCHVMETPGHTRDGLSYYFPEINAIFPGEVIGVPDLDSGTEVQVEFLTSCDDYLAAIERIIDLAPEFIGMAHGWYFTGRDAALFLEKSLSATLAYRNLIKGHLKSTGGNIEEASQRIARREYDEKGTIFQERNAYMANLHAQVSHIAESMENETGRKA